MHTRDQSGAASRSLVIWLSIPLVLVGLVFGGWSAVRYKHEKARTQWKTAALGRLAGLSLTSEEVSEELETLKANRGAGEHQQWTGERVLLMTNDEFLVYESRHGSNGGFVDHLFLARGSDGRWYYTTYHFCNGMVAVMGDDPPGSITEFTRTYSAREFDGKSDICLQHTWPVKSKE
jgi:hypothetical protein